MFNIYDIFSGWITISFGKHKSDIDHIPKDREVFCMSYIDDVKTIFDNLFILNEENKEKSFQFDLEGEDLTINTKLYEDKIFIECIYDYTIPTEKYIYTFTYKDFLKDYYEKMSSVKDLYIKEFAYIEENFKWENSNWKNIHKIIK